MYGWVVTVMYLQLLSLSAALHDHTPNRGSPYTSNFSDAQLTFDPQVTTPTYRVMDSSGTVLEPENDPQVRNMATVVPPQALLPPSSVE